MKNYYISKNETSTGPFNLDQLKYHGILPETKVWYEGLPDWVEARTLPELSELFAVPLSMAVPPPIKSEAKTTDWVSIFWRVAAVGTFVLMIVVAYWTFSKKETEVVTNPESTITDNLPENDVNIMNVDVVKDQSDQTSKLEQRKEFLRDNWTNLIEVKITGISTKTFGGMSDVFVVVKNSMEYDVEMIYFEAFYILENGEQWKSREYVVRNIPANGYSQPLQIEGSHRGKEIKFQFINIICKGIGIEQELLR